MQKTTGDIKTIKNGDIIYDLLFHLSLRCENGEIMEAEIIECEETTMLGTYIIDRDDLIHGFGMTENNPYGLQNLSVALSSNPNRTYSLMCFRFCKHENIVECILKSIQYETEIDILSSDIYPESLQDNDKSKIKAEDKFQYYYNPKVDFGDDNKKIIEDFIKFIERNENNICKDIEQ